EPVRDYRHRKPEPRDVRFGMHLHRSKEIRVLIEKRLVDLEMRFSLFVNAVELLELHQADRPLQVQWLKIVAHFGEDILMVNGQVRGSRQPGIEAMATGAVFQ